jgi:hypothetical protein
MPRFPNARSKIEWSNQHIGNLIGLVQRLKESRPYAIREQRNPHTVKWHLKCLLSRDITGDLRTISLVAADAVHNLRSSLDYIIHALADERIAAGIMAPPDDRTRRRMGFASSATRDDLKDDFAPR